jgi:GDP-mannose transporter
LTEYNEISDLVDRYSGASYYELYSLWFAVILSGIGGMSISYSSGWALRVTSSTTFSMAGALNKLPLSVFGMVLFETVTGTRILSVMLACAAGLTYTYARNVQGKEGYSIPMHSKERSGRG